MSGITLLRGEELKMQLKPHMFSFFHLYLTFFLLLIWSYVIYDFFNSDKFSDFPFYDSIEALVQDSEVLAGAIIWSFGLFLVGFIARYFFLDSGGQGIFRLYSGVALFGIIVMAYHAYSDMADTMSFGRWFIPSLTAVVGLTGLFSVDFYRRSFTYYLTDNRIVLQSSFLMNRSERQVRYNHIEDIKMEQGIFGTIFGFGTVLPLTGSGLGTGTDESMVAGGTGTEVKGMSFGIGGAARNSSRSVRHNPHDCLFGVSSPSKVRDMITENIQSDTGVEHLKQIKELLGKEESEE
ncbi:MAG: PH domain-containing protein [Candidatus Thermoplasmatota archaeon]|nr:PH domain-containing protein [Candidatus Thermoplasmatota archaeon]MEC7349871.1 PH domain-containing protein [Candidatus Thermoplasmatota archaeon]MEC7493972.1 PH domain-containing protein [Candidatus Thermoplasmatota archaeon]MEC7697881.1 PH domain-containing protein [Candidatus Thermoplasmatota archaeon]MEC7977197.1 PH domain-containing protein [Candidatus Thermoplasmatota archaeon]